MISENQIFIRMQLDLEKKIYVAGHKGMVGSAIVRRLRSLGYKNLLMKSHAELDLTNQDAVRIFFEQERPDQVFLAAAKVGGIYANNSFPADFIYKNILIQCNVIHHAYMNNVKQLLFLGSSCIYPRLAPQPMGEDALLTGKLEPTNEPYAIAKIAGIKMCESYNRQYGDSHGIDYRSVMPTNLYGPGDNFHPQNSHVIPALLRRFHEAKIAGELNVVVWGSGKPRREFLHVDDMAAACVYIMEISTDDFSRNIDSMLSHINVGAGFDISIAELANSVATVVGYDGQISYDYSKPDGAPQKLMDSSKLFDLGWSPSIDLIDGLKDAYKHMLINELA
jgi:GDP-L-fucose synthase